MMATEKTRGLGRGLSALLGEAETSADPTSGVREIPIELIAANPDQPRHAFDEGEIATLTESVREKGLLQPILVRPAAAPGYYQIVAGERRWRAAQRAGLKTIPALIRELDDSETLEVAIVENVQRADLNPVEEAMGYRALVDRFGRTQEQVSAVVGKSRSHVTNLMRLLTLPDQVIAMLEDGRLSAGHARTLVGAADPVALAHRVIKDGLNVRLAEALVKSESKPDPSKGGRPAKVKDADTIALERDLSQRMGLKVDVVDRGGAGEIRISYSTLEQLDDLCRRLLRAQS
jgi:ParB family chromosome partitioning protein